MPHDHSHGHHHHHHNQGDKTLAWAVVVNVALSVAQIIGGAVAGSVALIADGVHNFADAGALVLAFGARRLARRGISARYTFGWARAEVIAALVNFTTLIVISIWLAVEAIGRLTDPPEVAGGLVMVLAAVALVVDLATAALTWKLSRDSLNIRAAFLHNLADAGASVAVLLGGVLIWAWGWMWVDPVVTILISVLILRHVAADLPQVWRILMLAAPPQMNSETVAGQLGELDGIASVEHLHLWQFDEQASALSAHLRLEPGADHDAVLRSAKALMQAEHQISHTTFEVLAAEAPLDAPSCSLASSE